MSPNILLRATLLAVLLIGPLDLARAEEPKIPPGGTLVLGAHPLNAFVVGEPDQVKGSLDPADSSPTGWAWRLVSTGPYETDWSAQLIARTLAPVAKGDLLLAVVTLRGTATNETGEAETNLIFQKSSDPWDKSLEYHIGITADWQTFAVAFTSGESYAAGGADLLFQAGFPKQSFEVGQVELLNYGPKFPRDKLPVTPITYDGREPTASWRAAAEERIEKIRKGPLTIRVVDENGQPVPDAQVEVRQTRHAFHFGSAVVGRLITGTSAENAKYREKFLSMFDAAVLENNLKWPDWESHDRQVAFDALDWLDAQKIAVRGHNLFWPSWSLVPKNLRSSEGNPLELRQRIDSHIRDEVTAVKGRFYQWDVVNEPYTNHEITDILGRESLAHWFKLAHECDPKPYLFLNDYAAFMSGGKNTAHKDAFEETVKYLKVQGAPIGGIGLQSHFGSQLAPPEKLLAELDRWGALDLQVAVTEFDIDTDDEDLQGDYTRDFLTALFSHPAVNSLLTWGFWEGAHWRPRAALFRKDWSERPAGTAWRELVRGKWWTTEDLKTDAQGQCSLRGFLGSYTISAAQGDLVGTADTEITSSGTEITVRLKKKPAPTPSATPSATPSPSPSPSLPQAQVKAG